MVQAKKEKLHQLILQEEELDLQIVTHPDKGRGIRAGRAFTRGEFVVEYRGELLDKATREEREKQYADEPTVGCYCYDFRYKGKSWCVDATADSHYLGRLINHSCKVPNLVTRVEPIGGTPHLILIARRDIAKGAELLYNYGDRDKAAIAAHPWLSST